VDPFASLVSASPRASSPYAAPASTQPRSTPTSSSLVDLSGGGPSSDPAAGDDEWTFASSLPEGNALPSVNKVRVLNSSLIIDFVARRTPGLSRQINVVALFSNGTNQELQELHFQVAVERVCGLLSFLFLQIFRLRLSLLCLSGVNGLERKAKEKERNQTGLLTNAAGLHTTATATVRAEPRATSAERSAAGDGTGRHRGGQGEFGEDPVQGVVPGQRESEGGARNGAAAGNHMKIQCGVDMTM
jgi:hypothetical protein